MTSYTYHGRPVRILSEKSGLIGGPHVRLAYTDEKGGGEDLTALSLLVEVDDAAAQDDATYSVYDSHTGEILAESPTKALVAASLAAGAEGHVTAALTIGDCWDHVPECDVASAEGRGADLRRVYVMAD